MRSFQQAPHSRMSKTGKLFRAGQGISRTVQKALRASGFRQARSLPKTVLYHGTAAANIAGIVKRGLRPNLRSRDLWDTPRGFVYGFTGRRSAASFAVSVAHKNKLGAIVRFASKKGFKVDPEAFVGYTSSPLRKRGVLAAKHIVGVEFVKHVIPRGTARTFAKVVAVFRRAHAR